MHRRGRKSFSSAGRRKNCAIGILGVRTQCGGLHVKTACLSGAKNYIVAKLNTNFPQNYARFGKPTIQGVIVLYDADNGQLLAVLDSIEITIKRPAAATAVAAKFLARANSSVATICGCGEQGRAQIRALSLRFRSEKFSRSTLTQALRSTSLHNFRANFRSTLKLSVICRAPSKAAMWL